VLYSQVFSSWQVIEGPEADVTEIYTRKPYGSMILAAMLCLRPDSVAVSLILGRETDIHTHFALGTGT